MSCQVDESVGGFVQWPICVDWVIDNQPSDEKAEEESHQDHGEKGDGVGVVLDHNVRVDDRVEEQLSHLHVERHERHDGAALIAVVVVVVFLPNCTREVEANAKLVGITEGLGWRSNSTPI